MDDVNFASYNFVAKIIPQQGAPVIMVLRRSYKNSWLNGTCCKIKYLRLKRRGLKR